MDHGGGWTSCVFYMNWAVPFALTNGIPNIIASPMQACVTNGHLGTDSVTGNFNIHDEVLPDFDNAKYILFIANNASIGSVSTCRMVRFAAGRKNGAKVVAIDPRLSETASKADEWISIRPAPIWISCWPCSRPCWKRNSTMPISCASTPTCRS